MTFQSFFGLVAVTSALVRAWTTSIAFHSALGDTLSIMGTP
jgi:hypothetical protein